MASRGLGMGLDAIFENNSLEDKDNIRYIRLSEIEPNKNQPRKRFREEEIENLAESIREHGVLQPVLVRSIGFDRYQIVAGERRWRAAKEAELSEIPVIIKELDDEETAKIALIENVQREDLNPLEEASAYKQLIEQYNMTQEQLAKLVGKSRPAIANAVRLLSMPDEICELIRNEKITAGHAKAIAAIEDTDRMIELANKAAEGMLTVRQIEKLAAAIAKEKQSDENGKKTDIDREIRNYITEMELSLREVLGRKIKITADKDGRGTMTIDIFNKEDMKYIAEKLSREINNL